MAKDRKADRHVGRRRTSVSVVCAGCGGAFSTADGRRKRCDTCTGDTSAMSRQYREQNKRRLHDAQELMCTRCAKTKPVCEFFRNQTRKTGYLPHCKDCFATGDEQYAHRLWAVYRLRVADVMALMDWQGGACGLCRKALTRKNMRVDHDHSCAHEGKGARSCRKCVRGLLCPGCNAFIGFLEPRVHLVSQAQSYLAGMDWTSVPPGTVIRIPTS